MQFCFMWCQMTHFVIFLQTDEDVDWTAIKRHVSEAITKFFESGDPITTGTVHHESSEYAIMWNKQKNIVFINPQLH